MMTSIGCDCIVHVWITRCCLIAELLTILLTCHYYKIPGYKSIIAVVIQKIMYIMLTIMFKHLEHVLIRRPQASAIDFSVKHDGCFPPHTMYPITPQGHASNVGRGINQCRMYIEMLISILVPTLEW
jgi:hypothetical protein